MKAFELTYVDGTRIRCFGERVCETPRSLVLMALDGSESVYDKKTVCCWEEVSLETTLPAEAN